MIAVVVVLFRLIRPSLVSSIKRSVYLNSSGGPITSAASDRKRRPVAPAKRHIHLLAQQFLDLHAPYPGCARQVQQNGVNTSSSTSIRSRMVLSEATHHSKSVTFLSFTLRLCLLYLQ